MKNGRVLSGQFVELIRMLLGGLPDMSSGDIQWLISLPGVEKRLGELIDSLLPEEGPGYSTECDGSMTWEDFLSEGSITFEGGMGATEIISHPREQVIVRLLRRDESNPVPLALAKAMIHSRNSIGACNIEEMLSWIVKNWDNYLRPLNQSIVFLNPGGNNLGVSLRLWADEDNNPVLEVEINRKEWGPGTYFAVVIARHSITLGANTGNR